MNDRSLWYCGGDIDGFIKEWYGTDLPRADLNKIIMINISEPLYFCVNGQLIKFTFDCENKPKKLDIIYCNNIKLMNLDGENTYMFCTKNIDEFLPTVALTYKYKIKQKDG